MKRMIIPALGLLALSTTAYAEGDAADGEKDFKKCRSCHTIASETEVIYKGGKTGPNLYGVIGRVAGSTDFKYSDALIDAGEGGLIWTEEELTKFIADPTAYLREVTGDSKARSKMTFKMKDGDDVAAYLASVAPAAE